MSHIFLRFLDDWLAQCSRVSETNHSPFFPDTRAPWNFGCWCAGALRPLLSHGATRFLDLVSSRTGWELFVPLQWTGGVPFRVVVASIVKKMDRSMSEFQSPIVELNSLYGDDAGTEGDYAFLASIFGKTVTSHVSTSLDGAGGLSGDMIKVCLSFEDGSSQRLVAKRTKKQGMASSKQLGLAREGCFYASPV